MNIHSNIIAGRKPIPHLFATAYLDDPVWAAIAPGRRARKWLITTETALVLRDVDNTVVDAAYLGPELVGAAVWEPPASAEATVDVVDRLVGSVEKLVPMLRRGVAHQEAVDAHRPAVPHWYLHDIVVLPTARGQGVGSRLLRQRLDSVGDTPIFLEATTPDSARLYERFGFRTIAKVSVLPGTESTIMLCEP